MRRTHLPHPAWLVPTHLGGALALVLTLGSAPTLAGPGAHGPNGEHLDTPATASPQGLARLPDGSVHIPMKAQRRLGLRTMVARHSQASPTLSLPGQVRMDPNAGGRVQSARGGRIEPGPRGLPTPGQRVQKGEVLAHLRLDADPYATGNQQAQLAELRSSHALVASRLARQEALSGTVPRKDIEASRIELQGLTERMQRLAASLHAQETLRAPISGVIARAEVVAGQVVEPHDVLFELIDPSRVLIEANSSDPALASRISQAHLEGAPGVRLQLLGAARVLRDGVLPISFRATSAAPGQALPLAIAQPVSVIVQLQGALRGIVLPAQAVVRNTANEAIVWIKSGPQRYIPQPVQFQPLDGQSVLITQGLSDDNRVVTQGAALIAQVR